MGYVVLYGDDLPEFVSVRPGKGRWLVALVLAGMLCFGIWHFRDRLIPGEPVRAAFAEFSAEVRQGVPFGEALEGFCRGLMDA